MRRKMLTVLFVVMLFSLTACGTKNDVEVTADKSVETVKTTETTPAVETTKKEVTPILTDISGWDDLEEWTIGAGADIDVENAHAADIGIPEVSMLIPLKSNNYTITAVNYDEREINKTKNRLLIDVTPTSKLEIRAYYYPVTKTANRYRDPYFTSESDPYSLDVDWRESVDFGECCTIVINNNTNDCSVELWCNLCGNDVLTEEGVTEAEKVGYNNWVKTNIEYISKQLEILPKNYTPVEYNSQNETYENVTEETQIDVSQPQIAPQDWNDAAIASRQEFIDSYYRQYQKDTGETIELIYNDDNDYSLIINDGSKTYDCVLLEIGEGTYKAVYNDIDIIELYNDEPDVFQVYALDESYAGLNGYYY